MRLGGTQRMAGLIVALLVAAGTMVTIGTGTAAAERNLLSSMRCDTANPYPSNRILVWIDVFDAGQFPSDGLPGPALTLNASDRMQAGLMEYNSQARVTWRNLSTGASGAVTVPSRARHVRWEANIRPGKGQVEVSVRQQVGAMFFVPMVNPQTSTCRTTVRL